MLIDNLRNGLTIPDLSANLIAQYDWDNNANDSSGNGYDLSKYGGGSILYTAGKSKFGSGYMVHTNDFGTYFINQSFKVFSSVTVILSIRNNNPKKSISSLSIGHYFAQADGQGALLFGTHNIGSQRVLITRRIGGSNTLFFIRNGVALHNGDDIEFSVIASINVELGIAMCAHDNVCRYFANDSNYYSALNNMPYLFFLSNGSSHMYPEQYIGQASIYDRGLTPAELEQLANYRTAILRS